MDGYIKRQIMWIKTHRPSVDDSFCISNRKKKNKGKNRNTHLTFLDLEKSNFISNEKT